RLGGARPHHRTGPCVTSQSARPRDHRVTQRSQAIDGQRDLVAGKQIATERLLADFEQTTGPDRAGAEQFPGSQHYVSRSTHDELPETMDDVRPATARGLHTVHDHTHLEIEPVTFPNVLELIK